MNATTQEAHAEQYLSFFIAGEEYALAIGKVREILEYTPPTRVPSMPEAVLGVINLRGTVVPVIDLARHFALESTQVTKRTCIVMAEAQWEGASGIIGVLAQSVSQVSDVVSEHMQAAPSFGTRLSTEFLHGMFESRGKFVLVLDLDKLLHDSHFLTEAVRAGETAPEVIEPLAADTVVEGSAP
jgi:purine-binding chemotaxis protein CheW